MLSYLRHSWEAGLEAPFVEEMISSALSDFAPYAGADQQQMRFVRRQADGTTTSFAYEENGEWAVKLENPHVGTTAFTTRGEFALDVRARVPLWSKSLLGGGENRRLPATTQPNAPNTRRRFISPAALPPCGRPGTVGVLEALLLSTSGRCGGGLRAGPFSLRLATGPRRRDAGESPNSTMTDILRRAPIVLDGSWCAPLRRVLPGFLAGHLPPSLRLSVALQHPITGAEGDTLAALCVHGPPGERSGDSFRFLLVQTLMSNARPPGTATDTLGTRSTLFATGVRWHDLGTLIGLSKSFGDGVFQVSASSMIHEDDVDYETAVVVDATPVFTSPTRLKFGINKTGRVGIGISTKIFDDLLFTLGVHYMSETGTRFGLEIMM